MRRKEPPGIRLQDIDKWLKTMIVSGQLIVKIETFINKKEKHRFTFTFPFRETTDTSEEDEIDDLRIYFEHLASKTKNRLNEHDQHELIVNVPASSINHHLLGYLQVLDSLQDDVNSKFDVLKKLSKENIRPDNAAMTATEIIASCESIKALLFKHCESHRAWQIEKMLQSCINFYTRAIERKRDELNKAVQPVMDYLLHEYYDYVKDEGLDIDKRKNFSHAIMSYLLPHYTYLINRSDRSDKTLFTPIDHNDYQKYQSALKGIFKLTGGHNQFRSSDISHGILIDILSHLDANSPHRLLEDNDTLANKYNVILNLTSEYGKSLCFREIHEERLATIKKNMSLQLLENIRLAVLHDTPLPKKELDRVLRNYDELIHIITFIAKKYKHKVIANHLIDACASRMTEHLDEDNIRQSFIKIINDGDRLLKVIASHVKPIRTHDIPDDVITRFIGEQFSQAKLANIDDESFDSEVKNAYLAMLTLGRIAYLCKREVTTDGGNKRHSLYSQMNVIVNQTFENISAQQEIPIAKHIQGFIKQFHEIMNRTRRPNQQPSDKLFRQAAPQPLLVTRLENMVKSLEHSLHQLPSLPSRSLRP